MDCVWFIHRKMMPLCWCKHGNMEDISYNKLMNEKHLLILWRLRVLILMIYFCSGVLQ